MTTFHIELVPSEPRSPVLPGAAHTDERQLQPEQLGAPGQHAERGSGSSSGCSRRALMASVGVLH